MGDLSKPCITFPQNLLNSEVIENSKVYNLISSSLGNTEENYFTKTLTYLFFELCDKNQFELYVSPPIVNVLFNDFRRTKGFSKVRFGVVHSARSGCRNISYIS